MANDIKLPSDFIHKHSVRARGGKGRGQLPHPEKEISCGIFSGKKFQTMRAKRIT